jgi:hypothetical protein
MFATFSALLLTCGLTFVYAGVLNNLLKLETTELTPNLPQK